MKKNDIYRWRYNDEQLSKFKHGYNGGTTYWCCSQIGIFDGEKLIDTYWGAGCFNARKFSEEDVERRLTVQYLGNLDELEEFRGGRDEIFSMYSKEDIVDISHSNMSRGGLYIKKGASKDAKVIRESINLYLEKCNYTIEKAQRLISEYNKTLEKIKADPSSAKSITIYKPNF